MGESLELKTKADVARLAEHLETMLESGGVSLDIEHHREKLRTTRMNSALHLYLSNLAKALNDAGLDMKAVIKPGVDIPWSGYSAKEMLWRPVQKALTGESSTSLQTIEEYGRIYETLNRHIGEKFGVFVEWPSKDSKPGAR